MDLGKFYSSPIWIGVREIFAGQDVPYKTRITATIHTPEQDYEVFKVLSYDVMRDYVTLMMDNALLKVMIPLGDYIRLVYPNKDNLEITVTVKHLLSVGDGEDNEKEIEKTRYKAVFDPSNPRFTGTDIMNADQRPLNMTSIPQFKFRLMDRCAEPLRVKTLQGVFRSIKPEDLIKAVLLGESQKILVDGSPAASGLDMFPPDQSTPISQIVIPSGTFMCELPTIIQEESIGVYKYGIGTYFQRFNGVPMWFVFPLYNHDRFDSGTEQKVAVFYSTPDKAGKGVERTYRVNGNVLEVVITGNKMELDNSELTQLNYGTGFRLMDQAAFMKKPILIDENNKAVGARGNLNQEVTFMDRGDGLNFVPTIRNTKTNAYNEISKVSARQTAVVKFIWENADPELIYPGMPMKYCFMQGDEVVEVKGTILGVHGSRRREGSLGEPDRFSSRALVSVATQRNPSVPEYEPELAE